MRSTVLLYRDVVWSLMLCCSTRSGKKLNRTACPHHLNCADKSVFLDAPHIDKSNSHLARQSSFVRDMCKVDRSFSLCLTNALANGVKKGYVTLVL